MVATTRSGLRERERRRKQCEREINSVWNLTRPRTAVDNTENFRICTTESPDISVRVCMTDIWVTLNYRVSLERADE